MTSITVVGHRTGMSEGQRGVERGERKTGPTIRMVCDNRSTHRTGPGWAALLISRGEVTPQSVRTYVVRYMYIPLYMNKWQRHFMTLCCASQGSVAIVSVLGMPSHSLSLALSLSRTGG